MTAAEIFRAYYTKFATGQLNHDKITEVMPQVRLEHARMLIAGVLRMGKRRGRFTMQFCVSPTLQLYGRPHQITIIVFSDVAASRRTLETCVKAIKFDILSHTFHREATLEGGRVSLT